MSWKTPTSSSVANAASAALHQAVNQSRLTVLHARSGAGKTSLLRAGLAPRLIREGRIPVFARALDDPVLAVKHALAAASVDPWPALLSQLTLSDFLGMVCQLLPRRVQALVLILDQFEEFFVFRPARNQRQPFIDDFANCYDDSNLPVRFVIALRDDYFAYLTDFEQRIRSIFQNHFWLEAMSREEAAQAITAPAAKLAQPVVYAQDLLDALLDDLSRGGMDLPQLQIICTQLYEHASQAGARIIDLAAYDQFGRAAGILGDYLNGVLSRFPGSSASLARALLKEMVSSATTRRTVAQSVLISRFEATQQDVEDTLARLVSARLVRRDEADGEILYELAHDYLATEIGTWIGETEMETRMAQDFLRRGLEDWRSAKLLLRVEVMAFIHDRREKLGKLTAEEVELVYRSAVATAYEAPYWAEQARETGVPVDALELRRARTLQFLQERYDLGELQTLCFDLGIDYEDLAGDTKSERIRSLLGVVERKAMLSRFLQALAETRPGLFEKSELTGTEEPLAQLDAALATEAQRASWLAKLRSLLTESFNLDELNTLCFDLAVDFENLTGNNKPLKAQSLIAYMDQAGRLDELLQAIDRERPAAFAAAGLGTLDDVLAQAVGRRSTPDNASAAETRWASWLAKLRSLLTGCFTLDEFKTLCFDLRVNFENLGGGTKSAKALSLLVYMDQTRRLDDLLREIDRTQPAAFATVGLGTLDDVLTQAAARRRESADTFAGSTATPGPASDEPDTTLESKLRALLRREWGLEDLHVLSFDLGIDYEELRGETRSAKADALVTWMSQLGRLDDLVAEMRRVRPCAVEEAGLGES